MTFIPFNKPFMCGNELRYITDAVSSGKLSGNGKYTGYCHDFFAKRYGFEHCLLTTSCTDALEMAAILLDIQPGDEVIMPSYTFVSTANAFALRGASIVFVDSKPNHPAMDEEGIEACITNKTKAIVVVHYAGNACNMDVVMQLASKYNLYIVEDAAQAIDSFYTGGDGVARPLGSFGHLAAFSFHETKNIISGEGGMLVVNDEQFWKRAEIIWEKGTNRSAFFKREVEKYEWVDIGSSFLPSELSAAFLYAQLEQLDDIQSVRKAIWQRYFEGFSHSDFHGKVQLPLVPHYASNNAHIFYLICESKQLRDGLIENLRQQQIHAVFHYQSLHRSKYYTSIHSKVTLPNCEHYADTLIRLPFYYELPQSAQASVIETVCKTLLAF